MLFIKHENVSFCTTYYMRKDFMIHCTVIYYDVKFIQVKPLFALYIYCSGAIELHVEW